MTDQEARIRRAVVRVQNAYPSGSGSWAKSRFEEWVAAVVDLEADAVEAGAGELIRGWSDNYGRAPQPGALRSYAVERQRRITREKLPSKIHSRSIDEAALIDALAYLESVKGSDEEDYAEGLIMSIRKRLPDRGATVESRSGVKFVRADPYRYDPPGTVRFAVRQPDDGYEFPRGPLNGGSR